MKVSVVVVTFNHEAFIETALRSVLGQRTRFDFEVIVSEDASTDRTRSIVQSWQARHPDRVRVIVSERNIATNEVVARGFRAARGEYVALLDGDDYWTAEDKLQTQADYLDAHPELSLCFHNAEVVDDNGACIRPRYTLEPRDARSTLEELWGGNPFATCTSMFRRAAAATIPDGYADFFPITDWPLYVLFAEKGDVGYIPAVMGAYRIHAAGLYSRRSVYARLESVDVFYRRANEWLGFRHDRAVRLAHRRYFYDWAREHAARGDRKLARESLRLGRGYGAPWTPSNALDTAKLYALLYRPRRRATPAADADS
jgi:glycosyltransferase involved in cell wall biosynthesis